MVRSRPKPTARPQPEQPSDSSSEEGDDFIGPPPPGYQSSSSSRDSNNGNGNGTANGNEIENESSASEEQPEVQPRQTSRIPDRRRSRKQIKPKKRKDQVTKEIMRYQSSTKLLIPKLPFQRLVREILQREKNDYRMQSTSLECLHEAAESYLVQLFEDSYMCTLHRKRLTLNDADMKIAQYIRGPNEVGRR